MTACFALSHRVALRAEEVALLDEQGQALTPEFWCETKVMFALADQADGPSQLDLGFSSLIYRWLGLQDESDLLHRFGMTISEALALDCGNLAALAASLEQGQWSGGEALALPLSHAWSARASRLMDGLPETGELVLLTLERALDGCPWNPDWIRPLFEALVQVASQVGDQSRERQARKMLATIDAEVSSREPAPFLVGVAAQLLTSLWCITHKDLLLQSERTLFPGINPSPETGDRVRAAIEEGPEGVDKIPIPVLLLKAWGAPEEATEEAVRGVLHENPGVLARVFAEVERLWGDNEITDVPEAVARSVAAMAVIRHTQLQSGFRPIPGEPQCPFYELHQGSRRAATVELAELLRRLRDVLERATIDPLAVAEAHLDAARESRALGTHRATRSHLAAAMRSASRYDGEPSRRDHAAACVAQFLWHSGEPDEAMQRLQGLEGELAGSLLRTIEALEREREALRRAEQSHRDRDDVETVCALVTANAVAGHPVGAEVIARDACARYPGDPRPWDVLARALFVADRHRDAINPCRKALSMGIGRAAGVPLLARALSHIGTEGRSESAELAAEAIESEDAQEALPNEVMAELAAIVQYAGTDIAPARRADDLVWEMRGDGSPTEEWLGSAIARRTLGVWAQDAPEWLARLAEAGNPPALARLVVDRVDALVWWAESHPASAQWTGGRTKGCRRSFPDGRPGPAPRPGGSCRRRVCVPPPRSATSKPPSRLRVSKGLPWTSTLSGTGTATSRRLPWCSATNLPSGFARASGCRPSGSGPCHSMSVSSSSSSRRSTASGSTGSGGLGRAMAHARPFRSWMQSPGSRAPRGSVFNGCMRSRRLRVNSAKSTGPRVGTRFVSREAGQ